MPNEQPKKRLIFEQPTIEKMMEDRSVLQSCGILPYSPTVFIIDDQRDYLEPMEKALKAWPKDGGNFIEVIVVNTTEFSSIDGVKQKLTEYRPNLILLDESLYSKNGREFTGSELINGVSDLPPIISTSSGNVDGYEYYFSDKTRLESNINSLAWFAQKVREALKLDSRDVDRKRD
jgi:DNA-binding NarL/FixJ family response regulator